MAKVRDFDDKSVTAKRIQNAKVKKHIRKLCVFQHGLHLSNLGSFMTQISSFVKRKIPSNDKVHIIQPCYHELCQSNPFL
jgi:hypothetical protein